MRRVALGLNFLLAAGPAAIAAVPFDRPLAEQTLAVPGPGGKPDRALKVHCITYSTFMVREVHEDGDIGTASVSVVPASPSATPKCGAARGQESRELPGFGSMEFAGAAGRFLLLTWPDGGNGATSFAVYDAITARKLYSDTVKLDGLTRFAADQSGDTLDLRFVRVLNMPCSLPSGGAACWSRFAREAKLPAEVARRAPPVQSCASAYARASGPTKVSVTDPSVVAYGVAMTISVTGTATVLSRGELSCWPSE